MQIQRRTMAALAAGVLTLLAGGANAHAATHTHVPEPEHAAPPADELAGLVADAEALRPLIESKLGRAMLDQASLLPVFGSRELYVRVRPNRAITPEEFEALDEAEREAWRAFTVEPARYYSTFYGTPMVYARVLDLAAQVWGDDATLEGKRILDLGYGQLGQLRLWAQMGAGVTGVEVDPILTAMYDGLPLSESAPGSVRLVEGAWPNDAACREQVGGGYDLFVSRNLLKRGYVKPSERNPAFPEPVGWGMDDAEVLGHLFDTLNPGGVVVVYSIGPAPDPEKPWSDISNPWPREAWEEAGFEVIEHDADESGQARAIGAALGWGERMDLESDLHGVVTLCRRPTE